jgi:hypothetical protein
MLRPLAAVGLLAALAGCGGATSTATDGPDGPDLVELAPGDGCGDAFFWATNADDTVAVSVGVDQHDRTTSGQTTASYDVGDPGLDVKVLRGDHLSGTFCTDMMVGEPVRSVTPASAGHVAVLLDPQVDGFGACGKTQGTVTVSDLVGDGLTFAPFSISTRNIGCYAG